MYKIIILSQAEDSIKKLDRETLRRISSRIDWLKENADVIIHHQLSSLPDDIKGLCRIRIGDYRILYWIYKSEKLIKIYEIEHRSKDYRSIR
ncbi:MAG: type II toxin-antitoxin system RelE/ParE family toxin [Candidatus Firestonebacteria bacterium]